MKKILITGGHGFTGIHACKYFRQQGYRVISARRQGKIGSDEMRCDMTNKEEVDQMLLAVRPDYILHLAGKNHAGDSWDNSEMYMKTNVDGTLHLLESARSICPQARILVIGSALEVCLAHGKPLHPYGYSKTMQTSLSMAWYHLYHMNVVVAKPPNLIGPGPSPGVSALFARTIVRGEREGEALLTINSTSLPRTFLDVRDAVRAYEDILINGEAGKVYEIEGGHRCTLEDLANMYKDIACCPVIIQKRKMEEEKRDILPERNQLFGNAEQKWTIVPNYPIKQSLIDTVDFFRGC